MIWRTVEAAALPGDEPAGAHAAGGAVERSRSYQAILRSTAIVGGSSLVNIAVSLVRAKAIATILGPTGVGLMGALGSIADLTRSVAEVGINSSGVRQIASAVDDPDRLARTVAVLRWLALALGLLGAGALLAFAGPIARLTFHDDTHAWAVAVISAAVLLRVVADAQAARLQGTRQIGAIAKISIWGSILGSAASVALVYVFREDGVAPALVAVAGFTLLLSWHYSRKPKLIARALSLTEFRVESSALLRLGAAFMLSGLATLSAAYVVRLILIRFEGLEAAGLYQAAWSLGGMYVAFVLQAMGTDFYPRLVAAVHDHAECNRLVNEQALISLLLSSAGVVATIAFAPWILQLLYTEAFGAAAESLRWIALGMAMRVLTWPLGYILVAKGNSKLFVGVDVAWSIGNVLLTLVCVREFGAEGAGLAFFLSYLVHLGLVYPICHRLTGFRFSGATFRTALGLALVIGAVQAISLLAEARWAVVIGGAMSVVLAVWSIARLRRLVSSATAPTRLALAFARFRRG